MFAGKIAERFIKSFKPRRLIEDQEEKSVTVSRRNAIIESEVELSYKEVISILAKILEIEELHGFNIWISAPLLMEFQGRDDGSDQLENIRKALNYEIGTKVLAKDPYHYAIACFKLAELIILKESKEKPNKDYYLESISYLEKAYENFARFQDEKFAEYITVNMTMCLFSELNIYLMLIKHPECPKEEVDSYLRKIIDITKLAIDKAKDIPVLRRKLTHYNQLLINELPVNTMFYEEWEDFQKEFAEKIPVPPVKALSRCSSPSGERAVLLAQKEELSGVELGKAISAANVCWHKGEYFAARDAFSNIIISNLKEHESYNELINFITWICSAKYNLVEKEIGEPKKLLAQRICFAEKLEETLGSLSERSVSR